jgi:hypothetical protein
VLLEESSLCAEMATAFQTCFARKFQSQRPDRVALSSGRLQVVFTKHVLSCLESSLTLKGIRTVLPSVRMIACCLHRRVY